MPYFGKLHVGQDLGYVIFHHRPLTDYRKSMEEALNLSRKINEALTVHDKKLRPNAGGKTISPTVLAQLKLSGIAVKW